MKLIFQSDDYGITRAVSEGILYGIKNGIIRSTGLFTNMPDSKWAAGKVKDIPNISVGIDINLVSGIPISAVEEVPGLVDETGKLIRSSQRAKMGKIDRIDQHRIMYNQDPFDYEEVLIETRKQVEKFLDLMGRKPSYMHGHAIETPHTKLAASVVASEYDIPLTSDLITNQNIAMLSCPWISRDMDVVSQSQMELEEQLIQQLTSHRNKEFVYYICHCGYVDDELLKISSFSLIRAKDLACSVSPKVKQFLDENKVELINHEQLYTYLKANKK